MVVVAGQDALRSLPEWGVERGRFLLAAGQQLDEDAAPVLGAGYPVDEAGLFQAVEDEGDGAGAQA